MAPTIKVKIACNILQVHNVCQHYGVWDRLTGAAGYLPNNRRPIAPNGFVQRQNYLLPPVLSVNGGVNDYHRV
jgi:hypothetical protein